MKQMLGVVAAYTRRWAVIRNEPGPVEKLVISLASIALAFVAWWALTLGPAEERIIGPAILPSLGETFRSFHSLWFERAVARSAIWSLRRVLGGFLLAAAAGVPLGVLAGSFLRLNAFFKPLSIFGRNVPIAALIPITLVWFGLGESQKIMFIFFASVAFIFFDSVSAVHNVPDSYLDAAYTLGAKFTPKRGALRALVAGALYALALAGGAYLLSAKPGVQDEALRAAWMGHILRMGVGGLALGFAMWFPICAYQAVSKVLFPLALPDIVNSLRLLFGLAFGYIMLAEVINAEFGLGAIINLSQRQGPREHIYLSLLLIALLAYGIDRGILAAQRRLFPYRREGDH